MSQRDAQHVCQGKPILMLNNPDNETDAVKKIRDEAGDILYMKFHDIFSPRPNLTHPQFSHVKAALDWAKDKDLDEVICVCQAGISRSSAMAYIINTDRNGPEEAVKVLDLNKHCPNQLIVAMGADLIGGNEPHPVPTIRDIEWGKWFGVVSGGRNPYAQKIMKIYRDYLAEVDAHYQSDVPLETIENKGQEVDCEDVANKTGLSPLDILSKYESAVHAKEITAREALENLRHLRIKQETRKEEPYHGVIQCRLSE
jgi:predicted protein tyrosine phosphatase